MNFEKFPQESNEPKTTTPETIKSSGGIIDSLKKTAQKAVQLGALIGALASAEAGQKQAILIETPDGRPSTSSSEKISTVKRSGVIITSHGRTQNNKVVLPTPDYSLRSSTSIQGTKFRNNTTGRVSGQINTPVTGFEKSIANYHKNDPNYKSIKTGYQPGTYSKKVLDVNQQIRGNVQLKSGLTKTPRRN